MLNVRLNRIDVFFATKRGNVTVDQALDIELVRALGGGFVAGPS